MSVLRRPQQRLRHASKGPSSCPACSRRLLLLLPAGPAASRSGTCRTWPLYETQRAPCTNASTSAPQPAETREMSRTDSSRPTTMRDTPCCAGGPRGTGEDSAGFGQRYEHASCRDTYAWPCPGSPRRHHAGLHFTPPALQATPRLQTSRVPAPHPAGARAAPAAQTPPPLATPRSSGWSRGRAGRGPPAGSAQPRPGPAPGR